jgi:hypothetical protein
MLRTMWSTVTMLALLVGMSSCVIHERDDWRGRRYDRDYRDSRDYRDNRYRDRDDDRDYCWREGDRWVCRRGR